MVIPALAVLITAGLQVPVTGVALVELPGKLGAVAFIQSGPIGLNVGVILGAVISILKVAVAAH